nr:MAG TPA: hypothetical protein [Caudoviricetes sp.]
MLPWLEAMTATVISETVAGGSSCYSYSPLWVEA